ncbi:MAG: MFS transporter [Pirellulales bacterium]
MSAKASQPSASPQAAAGGSQTLIFIASFLTLIAAGMGFGARGEILGQWARYGFTKTDLGQISGFGLAGFGGIILIASLVTDRIGYKAIMLAAFVCHLVSAGILLAADSIFNTQGTAGAFRYLSLGMTIFSVGNGLCEAAINPLVATLYPTKKTHYLNILHAGWPGGLVLGALCGKYLGHMGWQVPMLAFLVPTLLYGLITLVKRFPTSEATKAGVSYGTMFAQLAYPLMIVLLLLHALVGYVELGTDSWISSITNKISLGQGAYLFIYASTMMFILRFFAGPIVERINPLGLLFVTRFWGRPGYT